MAITVITTISITRTTHPTTMPTMQPVEHPAPEPISPGSAFTVVSGLVWGLSMSIVAIVVSGSDVDIVIVVTGSEIKVVNVYIIMNSEAIITEV